MARWDGWEKRDKLVAMKVTKSEYEKIKSLAKEEGLTVSDYMRGFLLVSILKEAMKDV